MLYTVILNNGMTGQVEAETQVAAQVQAQAIIDQVAATTTEIPPVIESVNQVG